MADRLSSTSSGRTTEGIFYLAALLLFALSAAITLYFGHAMSGGMPMPGNWKMSMMWMPMEGTLRPALMFLEMWLAMMIAMMLPSTMPVLLLYRRAARFRRQSRLGGATLALGAGYFLVWTAFGAAVYMIGAVLARAAMHSDAWSRTVPLAGGLALCLAGAYQLTPLKSVCLKHCRDPLSLVSTHLDGWGAAMRLGLHHGGFCVACCWALMLMQLILGVMNLGVMVAVAVVIAAEKLLARGMWIAKATGVVALTAGAWIIAQGLRSFT